MHKKKRQFMRHIIGYIDSQVTIRFSESSELKETNQWVTLANGTTTRVITKAM